MSTSSRQAEEAAAAATATRASEDVAVRCPLIRLRGVANWKVFHMMPRWVGVRVMLINV